MWLEQNSTGVQTQPQRSERGGITRRTTSSGAGENRVYGVSSYFWIGVWALPSQGVRRHGPLAPPDKASLHGLALRPHREAGRERRDAGSHGHDYG